MAAGTGSRTNSSKKISSAKTGTSKKTSTGKRTSTNARSRKKAADPMDSAILYDVLMIGLFAVAVILFLCNFGIIGTAGNAISGVMFGLFGLLAYVAPIILFLAIAFGTINQGSMIARRKLIAGAVLVMLLGIMFELFAGNLKEDAAYSISQIYGRCRDERSGGGALFGSVAYFLYHFLSTVGTILVVIVVGIICMVIITEKTFVDSVVSGSHRVMEMSRDDAERRRERAIARREEMERRREEAAQQRKLREEERENEKILRMDKKVSGVMLDTALKENHEEDGRDDIHEIMIDSLNDIPVQSIEREVERTDNFIPMPDFEKINIRTAHQVTLNENYEEEQYSEWDEPVQFSESSYEEIDGSYNSESNSYEETYYESDVSYEEDSFNESDTVRSRADAREHVSPVSSAGRPRPVAKPAEKRTENGVENAQLVSDIAEAKQNMPKKYIFPPLSRLQKGAGKTGDSMNTLRETATRLQQTLNTFGVRVTITDISQGPSVTRYELQPDQGVKVSKIVGLADDIKLNLAATDIRIEAPIPGKAAVGIEVPNKENSMVALRDLFESKEFKEFPSNIAFAVGKDIAGKVIVTDIAKMPHMLIAGSTGSGKSVCINTLIMSILYKAHPDDVKLIMVDPKVVELSVYNGIPHLMIPVVTDPKKAAAALQWAVAEMTDRYKKFADYNVRDLKGYNQKVEGLRNGGDAEAPAKLPQIVIIVDELADLMMVAAGEVEEAICRLAQLARACGIHLIIATQRPSVDVITGLIKANMPSRVAFAVSSGTDSRTILDMNGAEKLLGKGDMLFYPQGYPKPARIQGAFVSDKEVSDVVDFLKNQILGNTYNEDIEEKIQNIGSSAGAGSSGGGGAERDQYFEEAAKFIIDKDKASIGMLQRVFKIGFNRAARIMDQLCDAGVVGEEEGTKPRKVLMSMEQFEQYMEEYY
ncbi:MAG: DNA translocase FtsK [Lachnospiraceae bacterium]|nr:DNA translocase FtsK [Lachnospiraceae bacterium]